MNLIRFPKLIKNNSFVNSVATSASTGHTQGTGSSSAATAAGSRQDATFGTADGVRRTAQMSRSDESDPRGASAAPQGPPPSPHSPGLLHRARSRFRLVHSCAFGLTENQTGFNVSTQRIYVIYLLKPEIHISKFFSRNLSLGSP